MSNPIVSVIIPTFNRGYCIERAINSVIKQTFLDWEILVIDNYSSDETDEIFKDKVSDKIKFLKIKNDGIIGKSRNLGISIAKGKYIAFLDSDDWWVPTKLENSLNALETGARVVYHDMKINYEKASISNRIKLLTSRHLGKQVLHDLLFNGYGLINSSVVVERQLLLAVSNISECEKLVGAEDYDLWLRISKHTNDFQKIDKVDGIYTWGYNNLSSYPRTLMNVNELIKRYGKYMKTDHEHSYPLWIKYSLAICHYMIGNNKIARNYSLNLLLSKGVVTALRLKSLLCF